MPSKDAPLAVEVPASNQDKPAWLKVGVIAAVGFIVGIAWPRVMGVRLGPSAPGEAAAAAAAASASAHGGRAPEAPPASVGAKSAQAVPAPSAAPASMSNAAPPSITVQKGTVLSCKNADGETKKGRDCGPVPGVDALVSPRIRKIATCSGVEGQTGKLSLVVNADFASGRLWYEVGKTSTVTNLAAITSCLKTSFHGTSTTATQHEHPRYTVVYTATFAPGAGASAGDDKGDKPSKGDKAAKEAAPENDKEDNAAAAPATNSGEALVAWEVALVRDTPKTGGLVSRLPRGTKVKVGSMKDGWYQIKFGDNLANEGWVYRGAIGR